MRKRGPFAFPEKPLLTPPPHLGFFEVVLLTTPSLLPLGPHDAGDGT